MDELLHLLPSLVALIDEASVTRAAKRLGVSQPRMSARLARLRAALGDPLLVTSSGSRGLIATDRAIQIAATARDLMRAVEDAVGGAEFDPRTTSRTFAVMANDNAAAIAGLPFAAAVHAAAPGAGLRVALHQFDSARLGELESGRLDLAMGSASQFKAMPSLITRVILRDRFVSAIRDGGDLPASLDEYCARDHVLVSSDGGGFDGPVDRALARLDRRRRVTLSAQSYLVAIEAVAASDMVATLPRALMMLRNRAMSLFEPPVKVPAFTLSAAWHPRADQDASHRWMREQLWQSSGAWRRALTPL